jgi:hypothetical protein
MSKVRITADAGGRGTVHVDGHEMTNDVCGVSFIAWAGDEPECELHLIIHDAAIDGEAKVVVPPGTASALEALGWTPPAEPVGEARG